MSRVCEICGKSANKANQKKLLRGHYNITASKRQYPNLQTKRIPVTATIKHKTVTQIKKVKACTRCLRALNKVA